MTRCQEGLLKLLIEIDELCSANQIEYCLGGGCLVGAIRNEGFLPWDDDADIHMTRENAEKFYQIQDQYPPDRTILTIKDYPEYLFPGVYRYVDTNTTVQTSRQILLNQPTGQFIDIIIFDYAASSPREQKKQKKALDYYLELHTQNGTINPKMPASYYRKYFSLKRKCEQGNREEILEAFRKKAFPEKYKNDGYCMISTGFAPKPFIPREYLEPLKRVKFENCMFPVPERSEEWLRYAYGNDWMYAPPVSEENVHNFLSDIDIPYTVIDKDHERFISGKEHYEVCCKDKDAWLKTQPERRIVNKEIRQAKGVFVRLTINNTIKTKYHSSDVLNSINADELYKLFQPYYTFQFSSATRYWDVFEPLDDTLLYYAMFAMIEKSDYVKCQKLITMRRNKVKRKLPGNMLLLEKRCQAIQKCVDLYYVDKNYTDCRNLVEQSLEQYPDDINLLRLKLKLMNQRATETNDYTEIESETARVLKLYPKDGEFIFFRAEQHERSGNFLKAVSDYQEAYEGTRNGFVLAESVRRTRLIKETLDDYLPELIPNPAVIPGIGAYAEWQKRIRECMRLYYQENDLIGSREMTAAELSRYPDDRNLALIRLYIAARQPDPTGKNDEPDQISKKLTGEYSHHGQVVLYMAMKSFLDGDLAKARTEFQNILKTSENKYELETARIQLDNINESFCKIYPDDQYKEQYPERLEVITECLDLYYLHNDEIECMRKTEQALRLYPSDQFLLRVYIKLLEKNAAESGEWEGFDRKVEEVLQIYPEDGEFLIYRGDRDYRSKAILDAKKEYQQALLKTDNQYVTTALRKRIYRINTVLNTDRPDIIEDPEYSDHESWRDDVEECIRLYYEKKDSRSSLREINRNLEKYPKDLNLIRLKLKILNINAQKNGFYDEFDRYLTEAQSRFPDDSSVLLYEAVQKIRNGDPDGAQKNLGAIVPSTLDVYDLAIAKSCEEQIRELTAESVNKDSSQEQNTQEDGTNLEPAQKRKNIYFTLLKEIDAICKREGIRYYLADDALKLVLRGRPIGNNLREVCIIMLQDEFDKFRSIVEKTDMKNRVIEGLDNNPDLPGYYYRYVARNTLFINISHMQALKHLGYCINIYIPLKEPGSKKEKQQIIAYEEMLRQTISNPYYSDENTKGKNRKTEPGTEVSRNRSIRNVKDAEQFFRNHALTDPQQKSRVTFLSGTTKTFSAGMFREPEQIEASGAILLTVPDTGKYLWERYGYQAAEAIRRKVSTISYDFICTTFICYEEYMEHLRSDRLLTKRFYMHRQKHKALVKEFQTYEKIKQKNISIWLRNGDRFKLWKYYMPQKEMILDLYDKQDYTALYPILKQYIGLMIRYRKEKLGICFDYDILMITLEVIRNLDVIDIPEWERQQMLDYVPAEHLHEDIGAFIEQNAPEGYHYDLHEVKWKDL